MLNAFQKPIETTKTAPKSCLYLHLMKCGGSSVHQVFKPYSNLHITHGQGFLIIQNQPRHHYEYGYTDYQSVDFSWACVRNPFARLASVWHVFNMRHHGTISMTHFLEICSWTGMEADRTHHRIVHPIQRSQGTTCKRPTPSAQWNLVDPAHWCPVERFTPTVSAIPDMPSAVPAVGTAWGVPAHCH